MKTINFYKTLLGLGLSAILSGPMTEKTQAKDLEKMTIGYSDPIKLNASKQLSYDSIQSQRGLQAAKVRYETNDFVAYEFGFNSDLKKAIQNSRKPIVYSSDSKTQVSFNKDTTSILVNYPKIYFDKNGKGKTIGLTIRDKANISVADPKGLGNINNHLPSMYWSPTNLGREKYLNLDEQKVELVEEVKEAGVPEKTINNFTFENNLVINNYLIQINSKKKNSIRLGLDVLGLYPSKKLFVGGFVQAPIKNNWFVGLYARKNLINEEKTNTEDYSFKESISGNLNFESVGFNKTDMKEMDSFEMGILTSYILNKFGVDVSIGLERQTNEEKSLKKGFDRVLDNAGNIINEKPFCVEDEFKKEHKNLVGGISLNYYPTRNLSVGLEGRMNNKSKFSAGIKTAISIGGKKKK